MYVWALDTKDISPVKLDIEEGEMQVFFSWYVVYDAKTILNLPIIVKNQENLQVFDLFSVLIDFGTENLVFMTFIFLFLQQFETSVIVGPMVSKMKLFKVWPMFQITRFLA